MSGERISSCRWSFRCVSSCPAPMAIPSAASRRFLTLSSAKYLFRFKLRPRPGTVNDAKQGNTVPVCTKTRASSCVLPQDDARRETSGGSLNRCDAPHGDAYLQRLRWYAGQTRWDSAIWRQDGQVAVYRGKVQAIQYRLLEG